MACLAAKSSPACPVCAATVLPCRIVGKNPVHKIAGVVCSHKRVEVAPPADEYCRCPTTRRCCSPSDTGCSFDGLCRCLLLADAALHQTTADPLEAAPFAIHLTYIAAAGP